MKRSCTLLLCLSACSAGMSKGSVGGSLGDAEGDDEDVATSTPPARDAAVALDAAVAAPDAEDSTDLAALSPDSAAVTVADGPAARGAPLLAILDQFSAPDVPARGPKEAAPLPHAWALPAAVPMWPGKGLAQHPMLYAGEGYNVLFVINHGKIIWTYTLGPGVGGEVDDVWMLSNGHVLAAFSGSIQEITPKKDVVWRRRPGHRRDGRNGRDRRDGRSRRQRRHGRFARNRPSGRRARRSIRLPTTSSSKRPWANR
jgi:hypothetical protein